MLYHTQSELDIVKLPKYITEHFNPYRVYFMCAQVTKLFEIYFPFVLQWFIFETTSEMLPESNFILTTKWTIPIHMILEQSFFYWISEILSRVSLLNCVVSVIIQVYLWIRTYSKWVKFSIICQDPKKSKLPVDESYTEYE